MQGGRLFHEGSLSEKYSYFKEGFLFEEPIHRMVLIREGHLFYVGRLFDGGH